MKIADLHRRLLVTKSFSPAFLENLRLWYELRRPELVTLGTGDRIETIDSINPADVVTSRRDGDLPYIDNLFARYDTTRSMQIAHSDITFEGDYTIAMRVKFRNVTDIFNWAFSKQQTATASTSRLGLFVRNSDRNIRVNINGSAGTGVGELTYSTNKWVYYFARVKNSTPREATVIVFHDGETFVQNRTLDAPPSVTINATINLRAPDVRFGGNIDHDLLIISEHYASDSDFENLVNYVKNIPEP